MANFTYLVSDEETSECAIIDPSWDLEVVVEAIKKNGFKPRWIVNTHSHFDHVIGNEQISAMTGAKVIQHRTSELEKDMSVEDGEIIVLGNAGLKVMHTPGHSPDSICLLNGGEFILTGDTLFVGNCGRMDLPGGDPTLMYHSLEKLGALDERLVVYPGHNYGQHPTSTIGDEKRSNPVMGFKSEANFVRVMSHGD